MTEAPADTRSETASNGAIRVRRALISVSDKTGVTDFAKTLAGLGVELLSTGGTAAASSWRLSPPPIPAWTTGAWMPRLSRNATRRS